MKKIISAFAVALLAVAAQAATVTWTSGNMYAAKDTDGTWIAKSGTTGKVATGSVTATIYLVSEATFKGYLAKGAAAAYADAKAGKISATKSSGDLSSNVGGVVTWADGVTYNTDDKAYTIYVADYTDATYGDFYAVGFGAVAITPAGKAAVTVEGKSYTYNAAINQVGQWTPVPEPCTVALLALGLAAVGLKRKAV